MKSYFTSDLHLGHRNVLKHDNRPFEHIAVHDQYILGQYANLATGSELWVLGDVAFNKDALEAFFTATSHLRVHLIRGNHDDKLAWKHRGGFESAHEALYVKRHYEQAEISLYLSHYAHRTWRNSNHGSYHLFGHSHGALPNFGRSMDVGVNVRNYRPVSLEEVIAELSDCGTTDHHRQVA